jgi:signal transduction histidine kinase/CheY-like chemotaxis protein
MSILTVPCASPRLEEGDADRTRDAHASEARRQATLDSLKILHTLPEDAYERIVRRVSEYFDTPGCLISFATHNQQWFKAKVGVTIETAPRESSFCQAALETDGVYVVHDATKNPRFAEHPFVVGEPGIRFYAGVALVFGEAQRIGTLCVIDTRPRVFGPAEAAALEDFAALVVDELRLRAQTLRLEAELQRQREAEQAALASQKARADFLAMVTHEVRAPLNAIAGAVSLMCQPGGAEPDAFAAEALRDSTEHLMRLLNEVLDLAKLEATGFTFNYEPFDLRRELRCAVASVKGQTSAKTVNLGLDIDASVPPAVMGDRTRIAQVLMNLLSNAIKFTAQGGVALIVEPGIWPNEISFLVRDTGIGIAAEAQERIFREFEQADEGTVRNYGGTGLGLAISERIVRRMGGRISLESAVGRGSTFEVAIPLPAAPEAGASAFTPPDLVGKPVMLVASETIEAALVSRRLERWGAPVCTVSDLDVARALLPERPWHAILVDHAFGAEALAALGDAARSHAIHRIVMVTPAARRELPLETMRRFTAYLVKPLRAASLAVRLTLPQAADAPKLVTEDVTDETTITADDRPAGDVVDGSNEDGGSPTAPARSGGMSILVAEDNEINALLMRSLLTRLGHHPVITINGAQAVESWIAAERAGTPYDLVLMDVQMPELDGIGATRRIREAERSKQLRRTPVIALTANTLVEDRYACFEAGMDGFLVKPLDRDKLVEVLADMTAFPHLAA